LKASGFDELSLLVGKFFRDVVFWLFNPMKLSPGGEVFGNLTKR
jgi:hypothetical protein